MGRKRYQTEWHGPRILAVDPGGTTGWALLNAETREFNSGQVVGHEWEHTDFVVGLVLSGVVDVLVIEDFRLRVGLNEGAKSKRDTLSPVRITEAVCYTLYREVRMQAARASARGRAIAGVDKEVLDRGWASQAGPTNRSRVVLQSSADAMRFATDERLREWGYYVTPGHARDAMRHAVLYAAKHKPRDD